MTERVVALLDMDCFYVQVEERDHPHIKGVPAAVVQYNSWKGGGIIAVNYEARDFGVKRGMRGDEARSKCSDIQLIQVPVNRGKADLTKYRDAGKEVINVLCDYSDCIERASIDEAYIDFTNVIEERMTTLAGGKFTPQMLTSTWIVGCDKTESEDKQVMQQNSIQNWLASLLENEDCALPITYEHPNWANLRLTCAAVLCEEMRRAVLERTGFKCSAGIAHNKMLAKLSCGFHKPNQQTVLPQCRVGELWESMEVGKVRNLGGKLGESLTEELGCFTMADLGRLSLHRLQGKFDDKTAHWLHNLGKGIDCEPVTSRQLPKSIGCGKNFNGRETLNTKEKVQKWMLSLAEELSERLDIDQNANKRRAKTLTVTVSLDGDERWSSLSRSCGLPSYAAERIARLGISLVQHTNKASSKDAWTPAIKHIGLSAGKFEDWEGVSSANIKDMFKKVAHGKTLTSPRGKMDCGACEKETPEVCISDIVPASESSCRNSESCEYTNAEENLLMNDVPSTSLSRGKMKKISFSGQGNIECLSNETKETSKISSNSFFKNFLLKKQVKPDNSASCPKEIESEDHRITSVCNLNSEGKGKDNGVYDENTESNDLDLLVSFMDEEGVEDEGNSSDGHITANKSKYVNNSKIEVTCETGTESRNSFCGSPDLFSNEESERTSENSLDIEDFGDKKFSNKTMSDETKLEVLSSTKHKVHEDEKMKKSLHSSPISQQMEKGLSRNSTVLHGKESDELAEEKNREIQNSKISVQELFPDLDDFDVTLLPLLPRDLRLKLEKDLAHHKANCDKKESVKKLWNLKYINSSPSECTLSARITGGKPHNMECSIANSLGGPSKAEMPDDLNINMKQSNISRHVSCVTSDTKNTGKVLCLEKSLVTESECTTDNSNTVNDSNKDLVQCKECGSQISAFELPEHLDYHVALKLQIDIQQETNLVSRQGTHKKINMGSKRGKGKKRGRVDKIDTYLKNKKIQKIDSFFKR